MSATGEYDHQIFLQKFSYGDSFFVYDADKDNIVGLIHNTPDSEDKLEAYMTYEDLVDTMGYDILEAMECKNGKICDESDSSFGEEH